MKKKTIYKIWCEWEMPELEDNQYFESEKMAEDHINTIDWSLVDLTKEEVLINGNVRIDQIPLVIEEKSDLSYKLFLKQTPKECLDALFASSNIQQELQDNIVWEVIRDSGTMVVPTRYNKMRATYDGVIIEGRYHRSQLRWRNFVMRAFTLLLADSNFIINIKED